MIHTSIAHALMAFFPMFPTVFETELAVHTFSVKGSSRKTSLIPKFVVDTIK